MVEHVAEAAPAPLDLARPWRRATYVASTVAAVELVLLLVVGGVVVGPALADALKGAAREQVLSTPRVAEKPAPKPKAKPNAAAAKLTREQTKVMVLNGNGRTGAAAAASERVETRGYRLGVVTNAPRSDYARSLVMFRPGFRGEAERLARDLGIRIVAPLDGMRPAELEGAHAAVILGARS